MLKPVDRTATSSSRFAALLAVVCALGAAANAHAQADPLDVTRATLAARGQSTSVTLSEGIGETDNIYLTPSSHRAQTEELTAISFDVERIGPVLDAGLQGDFNYLYYLQHAYDAQLFGRFDGASTLKLIPDHLQWLLADDYGDAQLDPYTPVTPTNLEHVNVVTTGPDVILRPFANTIVQLGARYAYSSYQVSPFDGHRTTQTASIERELSSTSAVALLGDFAQLRFNDTAVNTDYDRSEFLVRYSIDGARTKIHAAAGEGQFNDSGAWVHGAIGELGITRVLSALATVDFNVGRRFTDAADSFNSLRAGAASGIVVAPVTATSGNYLSNYANAALNVQGLRTGIRVSARWERDTYSVATSQNVTRADLEVALNREITRLIAAGAFATFDQSRYFSQGFRETDYGIGAEVRVRSTRTLSFEFRYQHEFRGTVAGGYGYAENMAFAPIVWQPLKREATPAE